MRSEAANAGPNAAEEEKLHSSIAVADTHRRLINDSS